MFVKPETLAAYELGKLNLIKELEGMIIQTFSETMQEKIEESMQQEVLNTFVDTRRNETIIEFISKAKIYMSDEIMFQFVFNNSVYNIAIFKDNQELYDELSKTWDRVIMDQSLRGESDQPEDAPIPENVLQFPSGRRFTD